MTYDAGRMEQIMKVPGPVPALTWRSRGSEFSLFQCRIKMVSGVESITEKREEHVAHWSLIPPQTPEIHEHTFPAVCINHLNASIIFLKTLKS